MGKTIHGEGEAEGGSGRWSHITGRVKEVERSQRGTHVEEEKGPRVGRGSCPPLDSGSMLLVGMGPSTSYASANSAQGGGKAEK